MTDRYELEQRLEKAEWVLNNAGFRRCDIAACNCGSWHQVGGFKARFDEIKEAVEDADYSTNGKILLDVVKEIIAEAKRSDGVAQAPSKEETFCHWLKGYLGAIKGRDELDAREANVVRNKLNEMLDGTSPLPSTDREAGK